MHSRTGKTRDMLCYACRTAWRDMLVTRSATCMKRVQGRRQSVDWGGHVHFIFSEVVPENDANSEHKRLNFNTRAVLLLRRLPCWNKHGHNTHDKRDSLVTTRATWTTRHVTTSDACHVVTWRNKWNLGLFCDGFDWAANQHWRTRQCPVCVSQDSEWPLQLQPTHRPSGRDASGVRE